MEIQKQKNRALIITALLIFKKIFKIFGYFLPIENHPLKANLSTQKRLKIRMGSFNNHVDKILINFYPLKWTILLIKTY